MRYRAAIISAVLGLSLACILGVAATAEERANLIPNPEFAGPPTADGLPRGWHRPFPGPHVFFCQVSNYPGKFLALLGGQERGGRVWCELAGIRPHTEYRLEFDAFRPQFTNGIYLEVEAFGQRLPVNQHFVTGRVQHIFLTINSGPTRGKTRLVFNNPYLELFAFGFPSLRVLEPSSPRGGAEPRVALPGFFPVGIYNARPDDLPDIKAAGFNAVQSYGGDSGIIRRMAELSTRLGLKYLPDLRGIPSEIGRSLGGRQEMLGFYIEDEPEARSIPPETLAELRASLKRDHPGVLTAVAMLRARLVKEYRQAADVFLLDPYPVPNMPMTWLSDSLEEAARYVPRERLWAVIQAFGGEKHRPFGWPRRPTAQEMRCLTYLALAHGAHGLFYFSYPDVRPDPAWEDLKGIVGELKQLRPWLMAPEEPAELRLQMISPFQADAAGRPAVHWAVRRLGQEQLLILVNVIERPVRFYLQGFPPQVPWLTEFFRQQRSSVMDGNIREELEPYEVRLYRYPSPD